MSKEQLPQELLVSPVVSLDDIENTHWHGMQLESATLHVVNGPGRVTFYRGDDPSQWLTEHGYKKLANSDMPRSTEIDGWYGLSKTGLSLEVSQ